MSSPIVSWQPHPGPQTHATTCPFEEILYGGAAGGGKTSWLIGCPAGDIQRYGRGWMGIIFRRSYRELEEIERQSLEIYGPVFGEKCYKAGDNEWQFSNGAVLKLRYLDNDKDAYSYHGQAYNYIGWDELTLWPTMFAYEYMRGRLRSASGVPCFIRATTNPGNAGHLWVKKRFIDPAPPYTPIVETLDSGRKATRVFIPAKVQDNVTLMQNDPGYVDRLGQISDLNLRRAMLHGDWDVFAGQAFTEWDPRVHVVDDFAVPEGVTMWRAMDWGYTSPYCCLWFFADGDGNVFVCNELYGCSADSDKQHVGSREGARDVIHKIQTIENTYNWWVPIGYLDPQCWAAHSDEQSIFEQLGGSSVGWTQWAKGRDSRIAQKQVVHDYLRVVNGKSRLHIMRKCKHLIRTLPALTLSEQNVEDVESRNVEDHAYDALRGGLVKKVSTREERRRHQSFRARHAARREQTTGEYGGW